MPFSGLIYFLFLSLSFREQWIKILSFVLQLIFFMLNSSSILHCDSTAASRYNVRVILRCQLVKLDTVYAPTHSFDNPEREGVKFLLLLPLEADDWKEWALFTKLHSNGAPALMEIDTTKGDKLCSHTLFLLSTFQRAVMQTVCSENRQNLMRLFFKSWDHCFSIRVCEQLVLCCNFHCGSKLVTLDELRMFLQFML